MTDPVTLRRYLREVLSLRTARKFTERQLFDGCRKLAGEALQVDELRAAIEWNQSRNYVDYQHDDDLSEDVYFLTEAGRKKEGLS